MNASRVAIQIIKVTYY